MPLKPQDVLVCLYLALRCDESWTYGAAHQALSLSVGELHKSVQRLKQARLIDFLPGNMVLHRSALEEFLIHGVKYAFAAERGARTRGVPTGVGASPLRELLIPADSDLPVWPHPEGTVWGDELAPLYKTVPDVALKDAKLYQLLALVDAIRSGRARERKLAEGLLRERLQASKMLVATGEISPP